MAEMMCYWPTFVAAFLTALACTLISLAGHPDAITQSTDQLRAAPVQSQIQFIVVPTAPTEAELHDKRVRDVLAQRNQETSDARTP